jgi:AbrB family looped-hinge helix DNA binding protein
MPASSTISSKGQITVPVEIRTRLGLRPGDRVEFVVEGERTVLRPARAEGNPFERYVGALPAFKNKKQINDWVTALRDADQG